MTPFRYTFTVFTPTYNRAHTLHRVYESLQRQTFRDFEWLIVDDGSTDATRARVERWQEEADFPIRYLFQENQGKHIAFNRGVREAEGELFLNIDSDDECVATALERFKHHWEAIPMEAREEFSAVTALCADQERRMVGTPFPHDVTDSDSLEVVYRYKVTGEKWGFHRTEVLRQYPFPEVSGSQFVPEWIVWSRIARRYRTRFVNEVLRVYHVDEPSLVHGRLPGKNAAASRLGHLAVLDEEMDYFRYAPLRFVRSATLYVRYSFHARISLQRQLEDLQGWSGRLLWVLGLPLGAGVYAWDRLARR